MRCGLCPHRCIIAAGSAGICGVRENIGGALAASGYGVVSSIALDPIEKKPLYLFHPGKRVLSIGGFGCNLRCPFCQNFEISMKYAGNSEIEVRNAELSGGRRFSPEEIADLALRSVPDGNIGVAYTYNEPFIGYEFMKDCSALIRKAGLYNVAVTNGYINEEPLEGMLPLIDAMNIDLKGFTDRFYKKIGGSLEDVKQTITLARRQCHVEITTLVIPGENEDDIEDIAKWLASVNPEIPLHLSRFFPRYRYSDRGATPRELIFKLCDTARRHLHNVFPGNI